MAAGEAKLDFLVIGAQKAGTTSLFEYLKRHPELYLPPSKEAPFFSHDPIMARGWTQYLDTHFRRAGPSLKRGSATPSYMVGGIFQRSADRADASDEQTVPRRIRSQIPDVKLIAILRDPIARALSHHRMARLTGEEQRTFDAAAYELLRPEALADSRRVPQETTGYIAWGEYGRILSGYFEVFDRERLLVLFTNELASEPERALFRVWKFLGVNSSFVPDNLGVRYREGGERRRISWLSLGTARTAVAGSHRAKRIWYAQPHGLRSRLDGGYERAAYLIDLWNRRRGPNESNVAQSVRVRLQEHFIADGELLKHQLGFAPHWLGEWDSAQ